MPKSHPPYARNTGVASSNWRAPAAVSTSSRVSSSHRQMRFATGSSRPDWMKVYAATA
jgi:hypothetical protein